MKMTIENSVEKGTRLIHKGVLMEWQGVAWLHIRKATKLDKVTYPSSAQIAEEIS